MLSRRARSVEEYFSEIYPDRPTKRAHLVSRHGEDGRALIIRKMIASIDPARVLDIGCGDGVFATRILDGSDAHIILSELSPRYLHQARAATSHLSGMEYHQGDGWTLIDRPGVDLILAIGVLDYWQDWRQRLDELLAVETAAIILTFPLLHSARQYLRKIWLKMHGIALQSASSATMTAILHAARRDFAIERAGDDLIVMVRSSPKRRLGH